MTYGQDRQTRSHFDSRCLMTTSEPSFGAGFAESSRSIMSSTTHFCGFYIRPFWLEQLLEMVSQSYGRLNLH
jgi:hypothetical protein